MRKKLYPHSVKVGKRRYKIKMVRDLSDGKGQRLRGYCDPNKPHTLYLDKDQSQAELFSTFWHEVLHAIEVEHKIKLPHKLVYALEGPIAAVLKANFRLSFRR